MLKWTMGLLLDRPQNNSDLNVFLQNTHFDFGVPFVGYEVRFFVRLGSMILNVRSAQTSNCSIDQSRSRGIWLNTGK